MLETNPNGKKQNILFDVDTIIDKSLKVKSGKSPHFKRKESCQILSCHPLDDLDMLELIEEIYTQIKGNWKHACFQQGSKENWRFKLNPEISLRNKSPEVKLERAIARIVKASPLERDCWANQVPTASGLVPPHNDKHRNIDLIHRCAEGEYEFIELKVADSTPLYAAMEILLYGLLYVLRRRKPMSQEAIIESEDTLKQRALLKADLIHLRVLTPSEYYKGYDLAWLEGKMREGLSKMVDVWELPFKMDFEFQYMPSIKTDDLTTDIADHRIEEMLRNRQPFYGPK
ncbi:MAG: hypothetical protein AABZ34_08565 [Nitrospirota bacterium]